MTKKIIGKADQISLNYSYYTNMDEGTSMTLKLGTLFLIISVLALNTYAEDKSYGCGAGALLAPKKTLVSTTTAQAIDLFSFPTRTFAITTGTSGCAPHALVKNDKAIEHFMVTNFEQIRFESALGRGEHLVALSQLYKCGSSSDFSQQLKSNYQEMFQGNSPKQTDDYISTHIQGCKL